MVPSLRAPVAVRSPPPPLLCPSVRLLLEVRLSMTLSCIQRLTTPLLCRHRHRPLTMCARPCRFRLSARPPMTVSCIQRLPTPLLRRHRHHPVATCARRRSFHLSGRPLAPLLWGALHCHSLVTSHYSVHVVGWFRMFCTLLPTLFRRISSVASVSFGHTIPSHVAGWFRVFGRPLPTLFRRSSSVGSGSLGDPDMRPSPFVPPLCTPLAPLLWGALHCHSLVTSHYSVHVVGWFRVFSRPLPTLFRRMSSVASASLGDCSPHCSVACRRLVPPLWETAPHTIPSHFVGWFRLSGRPLAPITFPRGATHVGMYCILCLLQ